MGWLAGLVARVCWLACLHAVPYCGLPSVLLAAQPRRLERLPGPSRRRGSSLAEVCCTSLIAHCTQANARRVFGFLCPLSQANGPRYLDSPHLTSYRQLPPAKCRHLLIYEQTPAVQEVGKKPWSPRCIHPAHQPSVTDTGILIKMSRFCLTVDKFFTRPLSTQFLSVGGRPANCSRTAKPPSRIRPGWRQSKHFSSKKIPPTRWHPRRRKNVPPNGSDPGGSS